MKDLTIYKNILTENSDTLKKYFKDISKYPVLSTEEQYNLAVKMKDGDIKARNALINSNLRFVISYAKQFQGQGVPLMDLISSGNKGLIDACKLYDPEKGYKFLSFAIWYIRREIMKSIYYTGRTIRYPITYIEKITKTKKAYSRLVSKYKREPTDQELIDNSSLTEKQFKSVILNSSYCQSIETPINENYYIKDIIAQPEDPYDNPLLKESIHDMLKILNDRQRKIIIEFYGLENTPEKTIKEIAKELGLGEERVRQLRKESIKKLRDRFGNLITNLV